MLDSRRRCCFTINTDHTLTYHLIVTPHPPLLLYAQAEQTSISVPGAAAASSFSSHAWIS